MEKDGIKTAKATSKLDDDLLDDLLSDDDSDEETVVNKHPEGIAKREMKSNNQLDDDLLDDLLSDEDDHTTAITKDTNIQSSNKNTTLNPSQDQPDSLLTSQPKDIVMESPSINTVFTSQQLSTLADHRRQNISIITYHF